MGTLALMLAVMLGVLVHMSIQENTEYHLGNIIILPCFIFGACLALYLNANYRYYEHKKYPTTEYNINKTIITTEEKGTIKTDTLYYFVKK